MEVHALVDEHEEAGQQADEVAADGGPGDGRVGEQRPHFQARPHDPEKGDFPEHEGANLQTEKSERNRDR